VISSTDILEATGLKSTKTLTRWHQKGIIPAPMVRTHPSGRGKIAYWPEWVLEFCVGLVQLQKEGHSLLSAARTLNTQRVLDNMDQALAGPSVAQMFNGMQVPLSEGRQVPLMDVIRALLVSEVRSITTDEALLAVLNKKLGEKSGLDQAINFFYSGHNMVLCLSDSEARFVPDFLLPSTILNPESGWGKSVVVVPFASAIRRVFPEMLDGLDWKHRISQAPKIWVHEHDALMEYLFMAGGPRGYEVLREVSAVIAEARDEDRREATGG